MILKWIFTLNDSMRLAIFVVDEPHSLQNPEGSCTTNGYQGQHVPQIDIKVSMLVLCPATMTLQLSGF